MNSKFHVLVLISFGWAIQSEAATNTMYDFGDLPDQYYTTLGALNPGPRHIIVPGFHLGEGIDAESDGQPHPMARGDDDTGEDDEDGIWFVTAITPRLKGALLVKVSSPGYVSGYIDFNADGAFQSALGEKVMQNVYVSPPYRRVIYNVPTNAVITNLTYARFRLTSYNQGPNGIFSHGLATDGEVEDYAVAITGYEVADYGDAPNLYQTLSNNMGAAHMYSPYAYLGNLIDVETNAHPSPLANGDDQYGVDDEDGVTFNTPLHAGTQAVVTIVASTNGYLNAWVDWDNDGNWTADDVPINKIFASQVLSPGANQFVVNVPTNAVTNTLLMSRFRFCTIRSLDPSGRNSFDPAPDGEVEDYFLIVDGGSDFGDAPDLNYQTLMSNNGAQHQILAGIHLGARIDPELDGSPDPNALGDDLTGTDDEDGVSLPAPLEQAAPAEVQVIASTSGFVNAWIDFNGDGDWADDPGEKILSAHAVAAGTNLLPFWVSGKISSNDVVARFRFSTVAAELDSFGFAPDGEVEDYVWPSILPLVDTDGDCIPDWWETMHFGGPTNAIATADPDNDGANTLDEFFADTLPNNSNSTFRIVIMREPGVQLTFPSAINRMYTVQSSSNLLSNAWTNFGPDLPGIGTSITILVETNQMRKYFRLKVDLGL